MYIFLSFLPMISIIIVFIIINKIMRIIIKRKFKPTHKVKLLTNTEGLSLRKQPDPEAKVFKKILNGTEIKQIDIGDEIKMGEIKGNWVRIITKEMIFGWCFSGSLEIINEKDYVQNRNDISIDDKPTEFEKKYINEVEDDKEIYKSELYSLEYNVLLDKLIRKYPISTKRDIENIEKKYSKEISKKVIIKMLLN